VLPAPAKAGTVLSRPSNNDSPVPERRPLGRVSAGIVRAVLRADAAPAAAAKHPQLAQGPGEHSDAGAPVPSETTGDSFCAF